MILSIPASFLFLFCRNDNQQTLEEVKEMLASRLSSVARDIENGRLDSVVDDCQLLMEMFQQLNELTEVTNILVLIRQAMDELTSDRPVLLLGVSVHQHQDDRGRPMFIIPREILHYYVSEGFKCSDIAIFLGVSERTVKRRLNSYGIKIRDTYADISDQELDQNVLDIIKEYPNIGEKSVTGHLRSAGYRVQQWRVRKALRNVDPAGVLLRRLCLDVTHRRKYSVRAPQALWHIDGYHKLIRYNIFSFCP